MNDRLPPHEMEMEQALLGCILQQPDLADECAARFKPGPSVFYDLRHQNFYAAFLAMRSAGEPIDIATVFSRLKNESWFSENNCVGYLAALPDFGLPSNFEFYADKISEAFMLRKTFAACSEAAAEVYDTKESADEVIQGIEARLQSIRDLRGTSEIVGPVASAQLLGSHLESRFDLHKAGRRSGILTRLCQLDNMIDGLQLGEMTVIGARPSQGKTALATSIVDEACLTLDTPTLFITLEMSVAALGRRILSRRHRVPMSQLKSGNFGESDFQKITAFSAKLSNSPIYMLDSISGSNVAQIAASVKRAVKKHGVKLVVVDYLQKVKSSGMHEKRTYEVGAVSTALKAIAHETNTAFLVLAQLNREPDKDKGRAPRISDLADSAQIERDADCIILLDRNREENEGRDAKLIVAKQRDGELGVVRLIFNGQFCSFENPQIDFDSVGEV